MSLNKKYIDPRLTKAQKTNCLKLATYLRALPEDYSHFDMRDYNKDFYGWVRKQSAKVNAATECNTVACALGHGPMAGIKLENGEDWVDYCKNFVEYEESLAWNWCFSDSWGYFDNTPHGAADRLELMVRKGIPYGFRDSNHDITGEDSFDMESYLDSYDYS